MSNKWIVPFEEVRTVDVHELYPILTEMTGLNQDEIFEVLYCDNGNGTRCYIDDISIEEVTEDCSENESEWDNCQKVYKAFEKLIAENKMPSDFYIYIWW